MKHEKLKKKIACHNQCAGQYRSTENVKNSFTKYLKINSQIKSCSINYKTSIYFAVKNFNRIFKPVNSSHFCSKKMSIED